MNKDDIIADMAKLLELQQKSEGVVIDMIAAAVKAEREACLALVNQGTGEATSADALKILRMERDRISAAIRARGEA